MPGTPPKPSPPSSAPRLEPHVSSVAPDAVERLRASLEGRYTLEREIGSGGMATVFSAEDIRHARQVAIKLLRPELSAILGGERFLNEIRVTAHLQHPHILPLLDSGETGGLLYYIMPYVDGESLRARIARERQLPIGDAVRIARDVADALDYAHRHGVIHRDVKPENILLHDGRPMVADFGIALAVRNAGGQRLTETGLSVGTPSYMSPEQATGEREVDARSDIYSLGCVLYEMLAGEPPHTAPTVQALMRRVVTEKPRPLVEVRETVPEHVADATEQALAKLPADRFATAGAFAQALQPDGAHPTTTSGSRHRRARPRRAWLGTAALTAGALGVGAAAALLLAPPPPAPLPPSRLSVMIQWGARGAGIGQTRQIAITPDGEKLVYIMRRPTGTLAVALHPLDAAEPSMISELGITALGDATHVLPPSSSARIAFSTPTGVVQMSSAGTSAQPLPVTPTPFAAWENENVLWYSSLQTRDLRRYANGVDSVIVASDSTGSLRIQQILPGARSALVAHINFGTRSGRLFILDLRTLKMREVPMETPITEARYTAGVLVYSTVDGGLHAARIDLASGRVRPPAVRLATDLSIGTVGASQFAVADNGTVVYVPNQPAELVLVDRNGSTRAAVSSKQNFHAPQFSPDGRRIAMDFTAADGRDVWVLDLDQRTQTRVTFNKDGHDPVWARDGRSLLYLTRTGAGLGIYRAYPGSDRAADSVFASSELQWTGIPLPAGGLLTSLVRRSGSDLVRISTDGRNPAPVVATEFEEAWPALSPDGRWLAYVSNQSGAQQIYVRRLAGDGSVTQVSLNGGSEPVWSRDGRELFYRRVNDSEVDMMVARVETAQEFRVLSRAALFSASAFDAAQPHANYDVSPDGRTFVAVRRDAAGRITVIQNVPELVRRAAR